MHDLPCTFVVDHLLGYSKSAMLTIYKKKIIGNS